MSPIEAPSVTFDGSVSGAVPPLAHDEAARLLGVRSLAEARAADLPEKLEALPQAYAEWIQTRKADIDPTLKEFANEKARAIKNCELYLSHAPAARPETAQVKSWLESLKPSNAGAQN